MVGYLKIELILHTFRNNIIGRWSKIFSQRIFNFVLKVEYIKPT